MSTSLEDQFDVLTVTDPVPTDGGKKETVKLGMKPLAKKQAPVDVPGDRKVNLVTNIRTIDLDPSAKIYQYKVSVKLFMRKPDGGEIAIEISNSKKKFLEHEEDKKTCRKVYEKAIERFEELREGGPFFYDGQAMLWSMSKIANECLSMSVTDGISSRKNFEKANFVLERLKEPEITSADVPKTVNQCPALADRRLLAALGTIISDTPNSSDDVITIGGVCHYFTRRDISGVNSLNFREGGLFSLVGTMKSISTVEGNNNKPELVMSNDIKVSLFHPAWSVLDVMKSYKGYNDHMHMESKEANRIFPALNGMMFFLNYGPFASLGTNGIIHQVKGFGLSSLNQMFLINGVRTSVYEHFIKTYNIHIRYKNLLTIMTKDRRGHDIFFPPELLCVYPEQVVTNERMINTEQRDIPKIAGGPQIRYNTTEIVGKRVGLLPTTKFAGCISISLPKTVLATVLQSPQLIDGQGVQKKSLLKWTIVFMEDEPIEQIDVLLTQEMIRQQMAVEKPTIDFIKMDDIHSVFERAIQSKVQFLFFITRKELDVHKYMKAAEHKHDVLTQGIHMEIAESVVYKRQRKTLENIVLKTNAKLGILNYEVAPGFVRDTDFVIGFSLSQMANGSADSEVVSVGFCSNSTDHTQKFLGAHVFVKRSKDMFGDILSDVLKNRLKAVKKNRNVKPERIVIYIHGVSEGQFSLVNEEYVQKCHDTFSSLGPTYKPELIILVSTKVHNERFYIQHAGRLMNVDPGTVVDTTVVTPAFNEFYHAGGRALQGTTKMTKYTVIHAPEPVNLRELEKLTNALCYFNQITSTPTSLPTPVHVAAECAKRGNVILNVNGGPIMRNGEVDLIQTNAYYGYSTKEVAKTRFNA